jgi:hypothetical protein
MSGLGLGTGTGAGTGAARENHDELLELMRKILRDNPKIRQPGAVRLWLEALHNHEDYDLDLRETAERYAGNNIFRRLAKPAPEDAKPSRDTSLDREKIKEAIAASIVLWRWKMPTTGKFLADSTFAEVAEAAPLSGKFLAKLSTLGAPGTMVREVFKNEKALQEFWKSAQGG